MKSTWIKTEVFCIYIKVIEAVYENLALKREIFAKLDKICKPSTILCSNTSSLDIDRVSTLGNRKCKYPW
jgi:3-hydroxyacyl-CoA dehydrogenase